MAESWRSRNQSSAFDRCNDARTAKEFDEMRASTVIRALRHFSIAVTGKPILFVSMGEKLSDLEQFYPDRMASRILGMGDVLSLIDKAQASIDIDYR